MTKPLAPDEDVTDIVEGGRPPGRQLPRSLVVGFYVVCGIAALGWVGVTVLNRVGDPVATKQPTLTVVGAPQPSYRPGHGELVVTLENNSDTTIFIDSTTLSNYGQPQGNAGQFATWGSARVVPADVALQRPDTAFWPNTALPDLFLVGQGGRATLGVTVDPPCGELALPSAAQVVVSYHTNSDKFRQVIPDLLHTGTSDLQTMVNSACHALRQQVPKVGPVSPIGRSSASVGGIDVSFRVPPTNSWDDFEKGGWTRYGGSYISKDTAESQSAEGVVYWTGFPDGGWADLCSPLLSQPVGRSTADLAVAVSRAPGTRLVAGPSKVTVGGHPAKHMVLSVRKDLGCDPGYFYTWRSVMGGPSWGATDRGDAISVWIVDVDGVHLFIAGETKAHPGSNLEQEIQQIIESIRFN